mmetsp:Transcript_36542/g.97352  ORF Transcript_36542/g.97352 Transcript_36542/m.97352 type:complete len:92 (-) Transcript_36542:657-932(-)
MNEYGDGVLMDREEPPLYGEEPAEVVTVVFEGDCEDTRGSKMLGRFTFTVVEEPGTTRIGAWCRLTGHAVLAWRAESADGLTVGVRGGAGM